jgi:hypothetical protein
MSTGDSMQKLIVLVIVIVAALLAVNYFMTGELTLIPGSGSSAGSDESGEINRLRGEFRQAAREFRQAGRGAALGGTDTSDAAAAAIAEIERVQKAVEKIARETDDADARTEAEALGREISDWLSQAG